MSLFEVGSAVFEFHRGQLAAQDGHEEVAAPARWLQEARIDALGLVLDQVEHRLDKPGRREDLTVVGNAFFGLDVIHGAIHFGRCALGHCRLTYIMHQFIRVHLC